MADTTDNTPLCPVCECGVVDDLVHIEHVHLGEVAAHNECLPIDAMLDAIRSARSERNDARALAAVAEQDRDDARARVTALKAAVAARDEQLEAAQRESVTSETSDGYHTFAELYRYRMLYNAALFNEWARLNRYDVHKSWRHSDGEKCFGGGWFVVYAQLPSGQISNHYEADAWEFFRIPERETGAEWDGHTPQEVATRLAFLLRVEAQAARREAASGELLGYLPKVTRIGRALEPSTHSSLTKTPIPDGVAVWMNGAPPSAGPIVAFAAAINGGGGWFIDTVALDGSPSDADARCHGWMSDTGYRAVVVELRAVA